MKSLLGQRSGKLLAATVAISAALAAAMVPTAFASSAQIAVSNAGTGTSPLSVPLQMSCDFPILGTRTVSVVLDATAPLSLSPGESFSLDNVSASLTISLGTDAVWQPQIDGVTVTATDFELFSNENPAFVNLAIATNGPLKSAQVPMNGSNPVTVSLPAQPIPQIGGLTATSSGPVQLSVYQMTIDVSFLTPSGISDLGSGLCTSNASFPSAPSIQSVSPGSGPSVGGNTVVVSGSNFSADTSLDKVTFGSAQATVESCTTTSCTVTAPPGSGNVPITMAVNGISSLPSQAAGYQYIVPAISGITPSNGPVSGGTTVQISGSALTGVTGVNFGSTPATSFEVVSDSSINAVSPPGSGTVDITVTSPNGTSATGSADQFTYVAGSAYYHSFPIGGWASCTIGNFGVQNFGLSIQGSAPESSSSGSSFSLSGISTEVTLPTLLVEQAVSLGYTSVQISGFSLTVDDSASPSSFVLGTAPYGPLSSAPVALNRSSNQSITAPLVPAPIPSVGPFTSEGSSPFWAVIDSVGLGLTFGEPNGSSVEVNTLGNCGVSQVVTPVVTAVTPDTGPLNGGNTVTISGSNFMAGGFYPDVTFGGVQPSWDNCNYTTGASCQAPAPSGKAGTVDIQVTELGVPSAVVPADHYTYVANIPYVESVSPSGVSSGTIVAVTGTGFTGATSVSFGNISTPFFSVLSDSELSVYVPPGGSGSTDVTVTSPEGTSPVSAQDQVYVWPTRTPNIDTIISPTGGPVSGGSLVVLEGSGFYGTTSVSFGGSATPFFYVFSDDILLVYSTPASSPGPVDIRVTNAEGTSSVASSDQFTYYQ